MSYDVDDAQGCTVLGKQYVAFTEHDLWRFPVSLFGDVVDVLEVDLAPLEVRCLQENVPVVDVFLGLQSLPAETGLDARLVTQARNLPGIRQVRNSHGDLKAHAST